MLLPRDIHRRGSRSASNSHPPAKKTPRPQSMRWNHSRRPVCPGHRRQRNLRNRPLTRKQAHADEK
jgi:hypothetical protein